MIMNKNFYYCLINFTCSVPTLRIYVPFANADISKRRVVLPFCTC